MFAESYLSIAFGATFVLQVSLACVSDLRHRRIPNGLVALLALSGILFSIARDPVIDGAVSALLGIGVGLAIWIGFYAVGIMGAGDVKFFAAAAAWLGPSGAWRAALIAAAAGGLLSVLILLRDSSFGTTVHRLAMLPFSRSLHFTHVSEMTPAESKRQLPYGVALAIGVTIVAIFPAVL